MSLLEKASLICTPNAYKTSKLYSVVPNTTLGDMDVVRATTATRVNSSGLISSVGVNIPRIDYTNGSCPSLLVEPQRTNLLTYSNDYSNAAWQKSGVTAVLGTEINPQGIASTYNITNTVLGDSYLQQTGLQTTTGNYTMSVFVKNIDNVSTTVLMAVHIAEGSITSELTYNWSANTIILSGTNAISGSSVLYNNGWVRLNFTYSIGAGVSNHWSRIYANNNLSVTKSVLVYGFQTEQGSYPTSYIPTVASTVTRNADVISKTGISSLIDSQQGVLFADLQFFTGLGNIRSINISNGNNNNRIGFYGHPSVANRITFAISSGGNTTDINYSGVILTNRNKVLIRYSGTTFTSFVNGVKSVNQTFTPFAVNFLNRIGLDYGEDILRYEGRINSIQLYKTALTDAECIALTTL